MSQVYRWKKGDTGLTTTTELSGPEGVVDLNAASVKFLMRRVGSGVLKIDAAAQIVDAAAGQVGYDRQPGDTNEPGLFLGEYEVTFAGGVVQTFPSGGHIVVKIEQDLG